jgi:hypothetical protein
LATVSPAESSPSRQRTSRPSRSGRCLRHNLEFAVLITFTIYFCTKFIHHFSDLSAPLTDLLRKSKAQKIAMTPTCMEAFKTLKLRLISIPCLVLPEVSSDATFTMATNALTMGVDATIVLQDQGGGLQSVSY